MTGILVLRLGEGNTVAFFCLFNPVVVLLSMGNDK